MKNIYIAIKLPIQLYHNWNVRLVNVNKSTKALRHRSDYSFKCMYEAINVKCDC